MDTQNLRAFMMVAEHASFSTAAVHLHLTQPAVSKRVASLEQQLGTALFDRIGRRVSLTEAGTALLPHARTIWQNLELAQQSITDLSGTVSGRLKLGTSHHIGLHRLAPVLRRFSNNYPQVKLDIDFMDSEQAYEEIMRASVELAVVTLAPEQDANMLAEPIWPDPLAFMADQNHPLCGREAIVGCGGEGRLGRQPVVHRHHHAAGRVRKRSASAVVRVEVAQHEAASVKVDQHWQRTG